MDRLQLELAPAGRPKKTAKTSVPTGNASQSIGNDADDVLTPKAVENPVVAALKAQGLYKTPLGSGKHDVTCPWVHEHTDELDTGAAYFEPDELYPVGGFCCQHSHRDKYHIRALLEFLGVCNAEARHKPVIRVVAGDLHRVVDAAEKELANRGRHYQAGRLIVSVSTDPASGDPSIVPTSAPALTRELSVAATWEKYYERKIGCAAIHRRGTPAFCSMRRTIATCHHWLAWCGNRISGSQTENSSGSPVMTKPRSVSVCSMPGIL